MLKFRLLVKRIFCSQGGVNLGGGSVPKYVTSSKIGDNAGYRKLSKPKKPQLTRPAPADRSIVALILLPFILIYYINYISFTLD